MKFKKRAYLYIILLIFALSIMILLRNLINRGENQLEVRDYIEIMSAGELNVVTDYSSIGYFVDGDTIQGFQFEMIKALEEDWGVKINLFLENSLDDNLEGLKIHKYDIIARNIPLNSELKEQFTFTIPITLNKLVLVQRKAEYNNDIMPLRQHLDLAKKTIYVPTDSPDLLRLKNLSNEIGDTIFIKEDTVYESEQLVMMVASGEIDFTVCNEKLAEELALTMPEIDIETDISFTQLESWAVRKDSPILLDSLNSWLTVFKNSERFKIIYAKYH